MHVRSREEGSPGCGVVIWTQRGHGIGDARAALGHCRTASREKTGRARGRLGCVFVGGDGSDQGGRGDLDQPPTGGEELIREKAEKYVLMEAGFVVGRELCRVGWI